TVIPASRRALASRKLPLPSTPNAVPTPPFASVRATASATFMAAEPTVSLGKDVALRMQVERATVAALRRLVLGGHPRAPRGVAAEDRRLPRPHAQTGRQAADVLARVALGGGLVGDTRDVLGLVRQRHQRERDVGERGRARADRVAQLPHRAGQTDAVRVA